MRGIARQATRGDEGAGYWDGYGGWDDEYENCNIGTEDLVRTVI